MEASMPVLVVAADSEGQETLASVLMECGMKPVACRSVEAALTLFQRKSFSLIFCNADPLEGNLRKVLRDFRGAAPKIPVVVVSRLDEWDLYLEALRNGAFDYLVRPFRASEVRWVVRHALSGETEEPVAVLCSRASA